MYGVVFVADGNCVCTALVPSDDLSVNIEVTAQGPPYFCSYFTHCLLYCLLYCMREFGFLYKGIIAPSLHVKTYALIQALLEQGFPLKIIAS